MTEETAGTPTEAEELYLDRYSALLTSFNIMANRALEAEREVAAMTAERDEERARSIGLEGERIELQAKIGHLEQAHLAVPRDTTCESPPEVD